jgi:hypothetical protein
MAGSLAKDGRLLHTLSDLIEPAEAAIDDPIDAVANRRSPRY